MFEGMTAVEPQQQATGGQGHRPHGIPVSTSERLLAANARQEMSRVRVSHGGHLEERHGGRPRSVPRRSLLAMQQGVIQIGDGEGIAGGSPGDGASRHSKRDVASGRRVHHRTASGGADGVGDSRAMAAGDMSGFAEGAAVTKSSASSIASAIRSPRRVAHPVKISAFPSPGLRRRSRVSTDLVDGDADASGTGEDGSDDSGTFSPPPPPSNARGVVPPSRGSIAASVPSLGEAGVGHTAPMNPTGGTGRSGRSRPSRSPVPSSRSRRKPRAGGAGVGATKGVESSSGLGGTSSSASDKSSSTSPKRSRRRQSSPGVPSSGAVLSAQRSDSIPSDIVEDDLEISVSPSRGRRSGSVGSGDALAVGVAGVQAASPISRAAAAAARGGTSLAESSSGMNNATLTTLTRATTVPGSSSGGGGGGSGGERGPSSRRSRQHPPGAYGSGALMPEEHDGSGRQGGGGALVRVRHVSGGGAAMGIDNPGPPRGYRGESGRERRGGPRGNRSHGRNQRRRGGRGPGLPRGRPSGRTGRGRRSASVPGYRPGFGGLAPVVEEEEDEDEGEEDEGEGEVSLQLWPTFYSRRCVLECIALGNSEVSLMDIFSFV